MTIYTLTDMNLLFPEKEIFLRLGGNVFKTVLPEKAAHEYRRSALRAFELCHPCGRWCVFPAVRVDDGILLSDGTLIPGKDFAGRNEEITALWCGAVTVGTAVVNARDKCQSVAESAIFDAVASECADLAMDHLHRMAAAELLRQGMFMAARRYSPGYGDMSLSIQKFFYERLNLRDLGLELTELDFFQPEKSVTAFAGIIQEKHYEQR